VGKLFAGGEGGAGGATRGLGGAGSGFMKEYFGDFKGIAGGKSEFHGILKIVHMYANHWCKLSPSAWLRTLSILLEVFFMDSGKKI
jgi:hypothetical protein